MIACVLAWRCWTGAGGRHEQVQGLAAVVVAAAGEEADVVARLRADAAGLGMPLSCLPCMTSQLDQSLARLND